MNTRFSARVENPVFKRAFERSYVQLHADKILQGQLKEHFAQLGFEDEFAQTLRVNLERNMLIHKRACQMCFDESPNQLHLELVLEKEDYLYATKDALAQTQDPLAAVLIECFETTESTLPERVLVVAQLAVRSGGILVGQQRILPLDGSFESSRLMAFDQGWKLGEELAVRYMLRHQIGKSSAHSDWHSVQKAFCQTYANLAVSLCLDDEGTQKALFWDEPMLALRLDRAQQIYKVNKSGTKTAKTQEQVLSLIARWRKKVAHSADERSYHKFLLNLGV